MKIIKDFCENYKKIWNDVDLDDTVAYPFYKWNFYVKKENNERIYD